MPEPQQRNNIINLIGKTEVLCGWRKASEVEWYERSEQKHKRLYGASLVCFFLGAIRSQTVKLIKIYLLHTLSDIMRKFEVETWN